MGQLSSAILEYETIPVAARTILMFRRLWRIESKRQFPVEQAPRGRTRASPPQPGKSGQTRAKSSAHGRRTAGDDGEDFCGEQNYHRCRL